MKQLVRKICGLFLAVAMVVTMIPQTSMPIRAEENYKFTQEPEWQYAFGDSDSITIRWNTSFTPKATQIRWGSKSLTDNSHRYQLDATAKSATYNKEWFANNVGFDLTKQPLFVRVWYGSGDNEYINSQIFYIGSKFVDTVNVKHFIEPVADGTAEGYEALVIDEGSLFKVNSLTWEEFNAEPEAGSEPNASYIDGKDGEGNSLVFSSDKYYRARIILSARDGYMFKYVKDQAGTSDDQLTSVQINNSAEPVNLNKSFVATASIGETSLYQLVSMVYHPKKYSVNFDANNGTTETYGPQYVTEDENGEFLYALPTIETAGFTAPEGGTFTGWTVIKSDASELNVAKHAVLAKGRVVIFGIDEIGIVKVAFFRISDVHFDSLLEKM